MISTIIYLSIGIILGILFEKYSRVIAMYILWNWF